MSKHAEDLMLYLSAAVTLILMLQLLFTGKHFQESFPVLQQVLLNSLQDPDRPGSLPVSIRGMDNVEMRRTALGAVSAMLPWLVDEHQIALLRDLVPLTIQVQHAFLPTHETGPPRKQGRSALLVVFERLTCHDGLPCESQRGHFVTLHGVKQPHWSIDL